MKLIQATRNRKGLWYVVILLGLLIASLVALLVLTTPAALGVDTSEGEIPSSPAEVSAELSASRDADDLPPPAGKALGPDWLGWPVLEVGVEISADYPGTSSDLPNAVSNGWGLYQRLRRWPYRWCNFSGNDCYFWTNGNAWEQDFKRSASGGTENNWLDQVDLVFYEGHGWPGGFTFGAANVDDHNLTYSDAYRSWGNIDNEWVAILSCSVLADSHDQDWAKAMYGGHLILGFENTAYDVNNFGYTFAKYVTYNWTIKSAWFKACDQKQPASVRAKVIANEWNHFWDRWSYQYPDSYDWDWWWWEHPCGSEPARQVDNVQQITQMPLFATPPLSLAEQEGTWNNLTTAFNVPTQTVSVNQYGIQQDGDLWVSQIGGRELEMEPATGLFYYIDHNNLFTETIFTRAPLLSPQGAKDIADQFLTDNGLKPSDAQFYEVITETINGVAGSPPTAGIQLGSAEVITTTVADYQVIYSRILNTTVQGANGPQQVEFSVMGPGAKIKVYVKPNGGAARVASLQGGVVGAMGGWRRVQNPGLTVQADVTVLPYAQAEQLFLELEPEVAFNNVPFDNPSHKEVLTYTLGYWEESVGEGQDNLYPAYVMTARYEDNTITGTYVVTAATYLPANETYAPPLALIESHSDFSSNIQVGQVVTLTAADASLPLNQVGYDTSLNFALGTGNADSYVYDWYLGSVEDANKIGSGRTLNYTVSAVDYGKDVPAPQLIILRVTDTYSSHASRNTSTDTAAFNLVPPLYLPNVLKSSTK